MTASASDRPQTSPDKPNPKTRAAYGRRYGQLKRAATKVLPHLTVDAFVDWVIMADRVAANGSPQVFRLQSRMSSKWRASDVACRRLSSAWQPTNPAWRRIDPDCEPLWIAIAIADRTTRGKPASGQS